MAEWAHEWRFWAWLIGLVLMWTGFFIGIIKWLIGRMIGDLDEKLAANNKECNEKWSQIESSVKQTDNDLKSLMIQLPMEYQRREDSIREYTAINSKLDRLHELLMEKNQK